MASVRTENVTIPVAEATAQIAARVYRPAEHATDLPVCVYYHSGGWATGDLDTEDGFLFCCDGVHGRALSDVVRRWTRRRCFRRLQNVRADKLIALSAGLLLTAFPFPSMIALKRIDGLTPFVLELIRGNRKSVFARRKRQKDHCRGIECRGKPRTSVQGY